MPDNYTNRTAKLLRTLFDSIRLLSGRLVGLYGENTAKAIEKDALKEYQAIIPQIPFVGKRNPLLIFLLPTSRYLALYRALKKHGGTVEQTGELIYFMTQRQLEKMPVLIRRALAWLWFSAWFSRRLQKRSKESLRRKYIADYVFDYIKGQDDVYNYGIDYLECASCKFLAAQKSFELMPYICAVDKVTSKMLGWGLSRTSTLAEGASSCDFRFTKKGITRVAVPASLMELSNLEEADQNNLT